MILALACLLTAVTCQYFPEEAAQVQVIEGTTDGGDEGIYIKVNGEHRDNGEQVYMQVNLNVQMREGSVLVNDHILPFSKLQTFKLQATICEISDGVQGEFEGAEVTVNFFLHEQTRAEEGEVTRAYRLETQIIETDKYDVHMFNVTEVVLEVDVHEVEIRRTVTIISETESKLHAAKNCPMVDCVVRLMGCAAYKKDENGCATCECAVSMKSPFPECPMRKCAPRFGCKEFATDANGCSTCDCAVADGSPFSPPKSECLSSCDGVCGTEDSIFLVDPQQDEDGCWICPCLVVDTFGTDRPDHYSPCDLGKRLVQKFEELPLPLRVASIALLTLIAFILTLTCCLTVCCRKSGKENKTNNLKTFGLGKLQIYIPDNEKKTPLIDNLDVVSADIA